LGTDAQQQPTKPQQREVPVYLCAVASLPC
jgi:hypothetical protein